MRAAIADGIPRRDKGSVLCGRGMITLDSGVS
jgi:hypothetical protein